MRRSIVVPIICLCIGLTTVNASALTSDESDQQQVARLYQASFDRVPDADGLSHWQAYLKDNCLDPVAEYFMASPEFTELYGEDVGRESFIDLLYQNVLDRTPDALGFNFWYESGFSHQQMLLAFSESPENLALTGTSPHTEPRSCAPPGWVDSGNGVYVPLVLIKIRACESGHMIMWQYDYSAKNDYSSASGAYQFLDSSWDDYGHAQAYGVQSARWASPVQQDQAALATWERDGTRPWNASRHCWSSM